MSKLVTANDLKERLFSEIRVKPKAFTIRAFDKKWPHYGLYFRPGEVTLWTGAYGNGKSTFLNYMIVTLLAEHSHVFIASMEIKPEKTIQRIARTTLVGIYTIVDTENLIQIVFRMLLGAESSVVLPWLKHDRVPRILSPLGLGTITVPVWPVKGLVVVPKTTHVNVFVTERVKNSGEK
jgi:ABC-type cobalamin/Fe3+-siderophores transport system ATPase subunit